MITFLSTAFVVAVMLIAGVIIGSAVKSTFDAISNANLQIYFEIPLMFLVSTGGIITWILITTIAQHLVGIVKS